MQLHNSTNEIAPLRKIAIVHSFYSSRNPSGENVAVQQHYDVLRRAGYDVRLFAQRTDERELKRFYSLEAAWSVATGIGPGIELGHFKPDLIHVHNTFPNYGKKWIANEPTPIVASLHNYRPLCSNGLFFRDGRTCTDCLDNKSSWPAVVHGCYKNRKRTIPVALGQRFEKDLLLQGANRIISLSRQMRDFYVQGGVPREKLEILSNFLPNDLDTGPGEGGSYWLYAGRLSSEKGIVQLLQSWPENETIVVVGSGEQAAEVETAAGPNVKLMGSVSRGELIRLMKGAKGLVFPSRCFEGFPMVYAEALAAGTPILSLGPSVMGALVQDEGTGSVGEMTNLAQDLALAGDQFPNIRTHCRSVYENKYTEQAWLSSLHRIYAKAVNSKSSN